MAIYHPELIEDEYFRPHDTAIISVPQKAPDNAILRNEKALDLLNRVKRVSQEWVKYGHGRGQNTHNVSATISITEEEWNGVGEWMWENRKVYNGLSVLPYDTGTYVQAPFEDCSEEQYNYFVSKLNAIDLKKVVELEDNTDLKGEVACSGGACEVI
jgi:ribonucleoside-diphosphate reductase alpha chain